MQGDSGSEWFRLVCWAVQLSPVQRQWKQYFSSESSYFSWAIVFLMGLIYQVFLLLFWFWEGRRKMLCTIFKDRLDFQQFHQQIFELILHPNYKSLCWHCPQMRQKYLMWNPTELNTNILDLLDIFLFACGHIVGFNTQGQGKKTIEKYSPSKWKAALNQFLQNDKR